MRSLHALVAREKSQLASIHHAYTWNDSVLLVSFPDREEAYSAAMHDADGLKKRIDREVAKCYAIAVKGQAFPQVDTSGTAGVTVIEASSWAMANCFAIEREARRGKWARPWYVDIRIARKIETGPCFKKHMVSMLGTGGSRRPRAICAFSGYLWGDGQTPGGTGHHAHGRRA
jgi:hypothetical protein